MTTTSGPGIRDVDSWRAVLGIKMPRITTRGEVERAAVVGSREDVMSPDEADAFALVLRELAAQARAADAAVTPHLLGGISAGRALHAPAEAVP